MPLVSDEERARFEAVRVRGAAKMRPKSSARSVVVSGIAAGIGWPHPEEEARLLAQGRRVRALDPVEDHFPARAVRLPEERVLHVHINGEKAVDQQAGLVRALQKLGGNRDALYIGREKNFRAEVMRVPLDVGAIWHGDVELVDRGLGYVQVRWPDYPREERQKKILEAAEILKPTLVFMQLQTPNAVDVETVRAIRKVADPRCVVVSWCGDIASENSPWRADWQVDLGRACDLTLHSSYSHVRVLRSLGIHNAAYLQIGYDDEQYREPRDGTGEIVYECRDDKNGREIRAYDYDVCFLGSRYGADVFSASMSQHDAKLRDDVVEAMKMVGGDRFGLFGNGFDPPRPVVPVTQAY